MSPQHSRWLMVHYFGCTLPHISSIIRVSARPQIPPSAHTQRTQTQSREECSHILSSSQHAYDESAVAGPAQAHQGGSGFSCEWTCTTPHMIIFVLCLNLRPPPARLLTWPDSASL